MIEVNALKDAICDLRFLLNRGYSREAALTLVANKYCLSSKQRNFLLRAVFSSNEAESTRQKVSTDIKNQELVVDGYNVLISVETALRGGEVFLCDDNLVRDAAASYGKHKVTSTTRKAIDLIVKTLAEKRVKSALFVFDSQVSRSGELCRLVRKKIASTGLEGDAKTAKNVDYSLTQNKNKTICSSDRAVIKKARFVADLPRLVIGDERLIKLPECSGIYELGS